MPATPAARGPVLATLEFPQTRSLVRRREPKHCLSRLLYHVFRSPQKVSNRNHLCGLKCFTTVRLTDPSLKKYLRKKCHGGLDHRGKPLSHPSLVWRQSHPCCYGKISRNNIICISKLSIYLKSISRIPNYRFLATCPRKQYKICSDPNWPRSSILTFATRDEWKRETKNPIAEEKEIDM